MNSRHAAALFVLTLSVGCGGDDAETPIEDTAEEGEDTCTNAGSAAGCLVYESDTCNGDTALGSAMGGHFYMDGSHLMIQLAPTNEALELSFEIVDTMGLKAGAQYIVPDNVVVTLMDNSDTRHPVRYNGCEGSLTITGYTTGGSVHGEFSLGVASSGGSCHVTDWYTSEGTFNDLAFCEAKDG